MKNFQDFACELGFSGVKELFKNSKLIFEYREYYGYITQGHIWIIKLFEKYPFIITKLERRDEYED